MPAATPLVLKDGFRSIKYLFGRTLDRALRPCLEHGYVRNFVSIFVGREENFVGDGVQNKRAFINANFLDQSQALFVFGQMTLYNTHSNSCFYVTRGR